MREWLRMKPETHQEDVNMEQNESPNFSLHEFKSWLSKQKDTSDFFNLSERSFGKPTNKLVGKEVYPKVSERKLIQRIEPEDGEAELLIQSLIEDGGVIIDTDGRNLLIEVSSGSFYLPRFCVRINKD